MSSLSKQDILGAIYTRVRQAVIVVTTLSQEIERQSMHIEDAEQFGDRWLRRLNKWLGPLLFSYPMPTGLKTELYDLTFPTPLTFAAFKGDLDIVDLWLRLGLGGGCLKTVLLQPREGNAKPRLQDATWDGYDGLLNALGLPGDGVQGLIGNMSGHALFTREKPIGVSVGGNSVEEYFQVFKFLQDALNEYDVQFQYYELNISCPNTPEGQDLAKHRDLLEKLLKDMRAKTSLTIGVKVSPDFDNKTLLNIGECVRSVDKTFINAGNTTYRTCTQLGFPEGAISIGGGGYSGPALFDRTIEMLEILSPLKVPLMATGGIHDAASAQHALDKGATLLGMATALVKNPFSIPTTLGHLKL